MLPSPAVPRKLRHIGLVLVAALTLGLGLAACGDDGADLPAGVVARVGDATIPAGELERAVAQRKAAEGDGANFPEPGTEGYEQLRQQALDLLVQQRIVDFEARKCGEPCRVSKGELEERLDQVKEANFGGSDEDFAKYLRDSSFTLSDARKIIRSGLQQEKLFDNVTRGVRFSEADARKYYDEHPGEFRQAAGRTASHILVKTRAEAESLRTQATPANFAALAREHSTDPGAANGGSLGEVRRGTFVPEFEKAAFQLKDGEISEPVETQFGWHLILVDIRPASTTSFAEAKSGIIQAQIQRARQDRYSEWRDEVIESWRERTVYAEESLEPPDPDDQPATQTTP